MRLYQNPLLIFTQLSKNLNFAYLDPSLLWLTRQPTTTNTNSRERRRREGATHACVSPVVTAVAMVKLWGSQRVKGQLEMDLGQSSQKHLMKIGI